MNQSFIIYIIQNMLLISLFTLVLFFIGRRVPLKAGHAWRKWLWAVLAVRLLLPVPVSVKLPVPENAAGAEEETEYSAGGSGEEAEAVPAEAASGDTAAGPEGYAARPEGSAGAGGYGRRAMEWLYMHRVTLAVIWAAGALFFLRFRLSQYLHTRKIYLETARPCEDPQVLRTVRDAAKSCRLFFVPEVWVQEEIKSPMLFRYWRPCILLPDESYDAGELTMVIRHELTHAAKKDLWYKLLIVAVCDIYWFNPVFRLMKQSAFQDVEYVCDEKITGVMAPGERSAYGEAILKTMDARRTGKGALTARFASDRGLVRKRLENLFVPRNRTAGPALSAVFAAVFAAGMLAVPWEGQASGASAVRPSAPPAQENPEEEEEKEPPAWDRIVSRRADAMYGVTAEQEREMQSYIEEFHVKMEFAAGTGMLEDLQDPDSVAWNYFFETGDVLIGGNMEMTDQGGQWFPLRYHNEYSLEDHLETLERFKGYVQGERLKTDFDRMILCVKEIREEKSVDAVILLHELLHDLDIYFLRYGTISAIGQTVGENSEEYYGVLRVYED